MEDKVFYVRGMSYDETDNSITVKPTGEPGTPFKITFIEKPASPRTVPSNWRIRFDNEAVLKADDTELRIKTGTEAEIKVIVNDNFIK